MKYSTETRFRKSFVGYDFLSFVRKFGDKQDKKLMNTATKTGIDAAKSASKQVVQENAEATGDLIGNKIPDKVTSLGKSKEKICLMQILMIKIYQDLLLKNGLKFMINQKKITTLAKKLELKHQC